MTKHEQTANAPIGIFDSGVGGLTVANAITNRIPGEKIIYVGDTAHLPYGDKSPELIRSYSLAICDFFVSLQCKIIIIACNTASAYSYKAVKEHLSKVAPHIQVIDVISPVTNYISEQYTNKTIGVIGTKGTIDSSEYKKQIEALTPNVAVKQVATPLFAYMIEEGFIYDDISNAIIRSYLSKAELEDIDALVLGCTHYPIIKNQIKKYYNFNTEVIDSSIIVADYLRKQLQSQSLLNQSFQAEHDFFVTDYTDYFKHIAEMFFDYKINLKKITL